MAIRYCGVLAAAALGLLAGCTQSSNPAEPTSNEGASGLAAVVVPDPDFTFETRGPVALHIEPQAESTATPIIVMDSEGRRLFSGVVVQPIDLSFNLPSLAERQLFVVTGTGDDAVRRSVVIEDGRASVAL